MTKLEGNKTNITIVILAALNIARSLYPGVDPTIWDSVGTLAAAAAIWFNTTGRKKIKEKLAGK